MTATTAEIQLEERDASESRQRKLATSVRSLRTRAQSGDTARTLLIFGGTLIPLGLVLILLGWYGASRTVNLYEQIPYSISGGMLGLSLVFAGGFCYFAYWLTQLVHTARRDAADSHAVLERIEVLLATTAAQAAAAASAAEARDNGSTVVVHDGAAARTTVGARSTTGSSAAVASLAASGSEPYLATATGTMYHTPDCQAVAGRDNLRNVSGDEPDLTACRICQPG